MSNSYDQIATVSIDIASAVVDGTSFDNILIVGPLPATAPATAPPAVGVYSSLSEVTEAGWVAISTGTVTADPVGLAAAVAFGQKNAPSKIYIAPIQTTVVEGTATAESAVTTVERAIATPGWYVVCPAGISDAETKALAAYVETQEKMMVYTELGYFGAGTGGANKRLVDTDYYRTFGIFGKETSAQTLANVPAANKYMNVAFAVAWLYYQSGSETAAFKELSMVNPAQLTTTEQNALKADHLSYFMTVGSKNITMLGQVTAGEWCDIIRFRDWLKNDMQVRVANLFLSLPKIPYTDEGISLIQNAMEASLKLGQQYGGIVEDEYDDDGNVTFGYTTSVPRSVDVSATDRAARELHDCKFKARLAGAIHFAEITGTLAYAL